ncbi:hypothetical protein Q8A73_009124 [Channa argus]|nr:hypothetical protein Q8A73_009124 [Channa argus]
MEKAQLFPLFSVSLRHPDHCSNFQPRCALPFAPQTAAGAAESEKNLSELPKLSAQDDKRSDAIKPGDPAPSTQPGITTDAFRVNRTNTPFALPMFKQMLESPWRDVEWTEERKTSLIKTISSYRPSSEVTEARVLLLGPVSVHQVALLTHVDQICPETAKDVSQVYKSCIIKEMIGKAGALLGMSTSYILPVKNYSSELDLDVNTDVLLLNAVDHILQYANLYFQDKCTGTKIMI